MKRWLISLRGDRWLYVKSRVAGSHGRVAIFPMLDIDNLSAGIPRPTQQRLDVGQQFVPVGRLGISVNTVCEGALNIDHYQGGRIG